MINASLKARLAARELVIGTFVKTPSPNIVEVLALSALDCVCLDAEHSPFDRVSLDMCLLAARAGGLETLVRVPTGAPEHLLNALDCGATGVLVPHVRSVSEAEALVMSAHYGSGGRGYAGSSRAAEYGTISMAQHRGNSLERTVVVAQIEDPEAVEVVESIARVAGLDALFVGRVDLTVGYGAESQDDPRVLAAVERVCAAGLAAGVPVGMFLGRLEDVAYWRGRGASLFLLGSDQGFVLAGANDMVRRVKD